MTPLTTLAKSSKLPPGSKLPSIIITIQAIYDQFGMLEKFQRQYGDIFYSPPSATLPACVIFSNPQAIEKVFTADPDLFEIDQQVSTPVRALLGSNSLVLKSGKDHQRQRKLLMPPFHGERMRNYGQTMIAVTQEVINQLQVGQTLRISDYTQEISLQIILRTIFGLDSGTKYDQLKKILIDYLDTFNSPYNSLFLFLDFLQKDLGFFTPWNKFLRQKRQIREILQAECDRRRATPDTMGEDILSLLLEARYEDGQPMSDIEIQDELMTMLFAGHETTANSLAWSFYWLHRLPEVGQKLQTELKSQSPEAELNDTAKLPYLSAVVSETLRLNPVVVFVNRHLKQPLELMGYQLPAGTSLLPSVYLTHQREDIYPEPQKFKPERFIKRQFSPYEYLPFGGGNRRCLGYAFALYEMKLVLAKIMSSVKFELLDNRPLKPARRGFAFAPAGGVKMKVTKILKNHEN